MERVLEHTPVPTSRAIPFVLFLAILIAFVAESQTAQYLQTTLGYEQPYFIFYVVHSSFSLCFPVHLIYILLGTKHGLQPLLSGLRFTLTEQVTAWTSSRFSIGSRCMANLVLPVICLAAFYNLPALLWFIAIRLASVTDVTAIWNANAFFAYVFSIKLLGLRWGTLQLVAVTLATLGVLTVVYGGTTTPSSHIRSAEASSPSTPAPFVGNLLTLAASVVYALYQVLYKRYIALPSDPELTAKSGRYQPLPQRTDDALDEETATILRADDTIYPPPLGLHPNLITSTIGLCTLLVFWIPIPFLHYYQIETFRLPPDGNTLLAVVGTAVSGVVFSAGLMILLGIWGPIVTSVGSLLTIVLTLISDLYFGTVPLTFGGLLGAGMIVFAFGILVYDMV